MKKKKKKKEEERTKTYNKGIAGAGNKLCTVWSGV